MPRSIWSSNDNDMLVKMLNAQQGLQKLVYIQYAQIPLELPRIIYMQTHMEYPRIINSLSIIITCNISNMLAPVYVLVLNSNLIKVQQNPPTPKGLHEQAIFFTDLSHPQRLHTSRTTDMLKVQHDTLY